MPGKETTVEIPLEKLISIDTRLSVMEITLKRLEYYFEGREGKTGILERLMALEVRIGSEEDKLSSSIATRTMITNGQTIDIAKINKSLPTLEIVSKVMIWLAVALGSATIALLWAILTHTVQIIQSAP